MTDPYDPRAAALDALAAMRWPDVSEPPVAVVDAMQTYLTATHALGAAVRLAGDVTLSRQGGPPYWAGDIAYKYGREGRPLVPPK